MPAASQQAVVAISSSDDSDDAAGGDGCGGSVTGLVPAAGTSVVGPNGARTLSLPVSTGTSSREGNNGSTGHFNGGRHGSSSHNRQQHRQPEHSGPRRPSQSQSVSSGAGRSSAEVQAHRVLVVLQELLDMGAAAVAGHAGEHSSAARAGEEGGAEEGGMSRGGLRRLRTRHGMVSLAIRFLV